MSVHTLVITAGVVSRVSTIVLHTGLPGRAGDPGLDGDPGPSAYDTYLATTSDDPVLSEAEWSASRDSVASTDITDSTALGRAILTAETASAARTELGAGTSGDALFTASENANAIASLNTDGALDVALCMPVYRTLAWISPTQTNTGTGGSSIGESVNVNTGTTANSTALLSANAVVNGWGAGALNQGGKAVDWTKRVTIGFSIVVILAPSANAKFGVRLGFQPAGDMNRRGIGIIVDGTSLKIETHNGTTRAVSSSLKTLAVGDSVYVVLQSFGGTVRCWINGLLAGTLAGAPTNLEGSSNNESISTFVANQADAANNRWHISPAMIRITF